MILDLAIFFAAEVCLILGLYRFLLRQWIFQHWEEKLDEEGWLLIRLEPVVDEIEDRIHDKLEQFQSSFFGSVGAMTKKAADMDPMNGIRKAAKNGDWTSMMVEYMANKSGLGGLINQNSPKEAPKDPGNNQSDGVPKPIKELFKQ